MLASVLQCLLVVGIYVPRRGRIVIPLRDGSNDESKMSAEVQTERRQQDQSAAGLACLRNAAFGGGGGGGAFC